MKSKFACTSAITFLFLGLLLTGAASMAYAQAQHVRWDISQPVYDLVPGGSASASAADGSKITMTGFGTFVAPAGGNGTSSAVTGGGTWEIFPAESSTAIASGTYQVEGLVRFDEDPVGTLLDLVPPVKDFIPGFINDLEDAHAGLAILRIRYSDGDHGILVISCMLDVSPSSIFEGITASKSFVDFFNSVQAPVTIFHIAD
jgi:hypothetical protein